MKIAFYAPLKSPDHERPSGDRRIARLFITALQRVGWEVELASELRAWEGSGDQKKQAEIKKQGMEIAAQLITEYKQRPLIHQPKCWFTYHLYHKAPDWIGPAVSTALDIPYVVAEASVAHKQRDSAWREGYAGALAAVRQARLIFNLNSNDLAGLQPWVQKPDVLVPLKPFVDMPKPNPYAKLHLRRDLAFHENLDAEQYWLLSVAMMRFDSKLKSYQILADTVAKLKRTDWKLIIVGDGPASQQVKDLFRLHHPDKIYFLGLRDNEFIHSMMRAADLFVWPAHNEALGMAMLESIGCGLPVVAGSSGGSEFIQHQVTGILMDQPDGHALAVQIEKLLGMPDTLAQMSTAAARAFQKSHRLDSAAQTIGKALSNVMAAVD